jgi:peptide/nickel transport system substrate-binding protein
MKRRFLGPLVLVLLATVSWPTSAAVNEIVIDMGSTGISNLDQVFFGSGAERNTLALVYETLVTFDQRMKIVPLLAESWTRDPDGVTWTFRLRRNVRFHDGTPLTASAVKFNFDRQLDPRSRSLNSPVFRDAIKEVRVVDEATVQFVSNGPYSIFLNVLAGWGAGVACPDKVRELGEEFNRQGCGTGPYTATAFTPGQRLTLTRHPGYWAQRGATERFTVVSIPEEAARVAALGRQTHIMSGVPVRQVEFLRQRGFTIVDTRPVGMLYLGMNWAQKPLDDRRVRLAIAHAINVADLEQRVWDGNVRLYAGPQHPVLVGYNANIQPYPHDLAKARQLLAEAGQRDLRLNFWYFPSPDNVRLGQVLQVQLKEIGVDLVPQQWEYGAYIARLARGEQQLFVWGWTNAEADPLSPLNGIFRSTSPPLVNVARFRNTELDRVLDQIRGEFNDARRSRLIGQAVRIIIGEGSHPFFYSAKNNIAHVKELTGAEWASHGLFHMLLRAHIP